MSEESPPEVAAAPPPPPRPDPTARPLTQHGSGAAVLLAVAAVVAALLVARASFVSSAASSAWQQALRQEIKRSAALVEDARYVYTDEASLAFDVVTAQTLAEQLEAKLDGAAPPVSDRLALEAQTQQLMIETFGPSSEVASGDGYDQDGGGYDLGARLGDVRDKYPDLVALDPDEPQREGDRLNQQANQQTSAAVLAAVTFLLAALAQVFRRGHRTLLVIGWVFLVGAAGVGAAVEVLA